MTRILETPRLVLREVGRSDASFILELMNERAYLEKIGDRGVRTTEDAQAYIDSRYTANYQRLGYGLYLAETKADGIPIGICGFVKREMLEHADVGFAYLEKFRAQGYGYESASAVLEHGRDALRFSRVLGVTSKTNPGSIRLLEKLGLSYVRSISLPGYAEESLLFSRDFTPRHHGAKSTS
jgi:RimJ/RimL family protein N-acetyltransferase